MSLPSFVVGDPDADLPVWVEWHSLKWRGLQRASLILLETRRLLHDAFAFVFGDPPRFGPPGSYLCLVVGFDLSWCREGGVRPIEVAPFRADLGPAATLWDRRAVFVDADCDFRDAVGNRVTLGGWQAVALHCAHGLGHLVGVGHEHGEPWERPDVLIPNARRARDFCRQGRAG